MKQYLCQKAFTRPYFAIAFCAMLTLHSSALLAEEGVKESAASTTVSDTQASVSDASNTNNAPDPKVMGFKIDKNRFDFPSWPEKPTVVKDVPPPPPLGPYMSMALNNKQAGQPQFTNMMSIPVPDIADAPMTAFSPDLPWPGDTPEESKVNRWAPAKGYNFVAPGVRPPQPLYNQGRNNIDVRTNRTAPQARQPAYYSHRPMPAPMSNNAQQNRAMFNAPAPRSPNAHYPTSNQRGFNPAVNYTAPANQFRSNPGMQQRHMPVMQNNGFRPYPNSMRQAPQVNAGYNRPAYGTSQPQLIPPSGNQR